jgi:hypothetical protein
VKLTSEEKRFKLHGYFLKWMNGPVTGKHETEGDVDAWALANLVMNNNWGVINPTKIPEAKRFLKVHKKAIISLIGKKGGKWLEMKKDWIVK